MCDIGLLTGSAVSSLGGRGPEEGGLDAIRKTLRRLLVDQGGATAIEYGLICALIAVAAISGISALGGGAGGMWTDLSANVEAAM